MSWLVFLIYPVLAVIGALGILQNNTLLVGVTVGAVALLGLAHCCWCLSTGRPDRQSE